MGKLTSPVFPIPPFYNLDGEIFSRNIQRYIYMLLGGGANNIMTTYGTSQFNLLRKKEVRHLNKIVIENSIPEIGTTILGLKPADYSETMRELEVLHRMIGLYPGEFTALLIYPDRYYDGSEVIDYFKKIAAYSPVPIMIHGLHMRKGVGGIGYKDWDKELIGEIIKSGNIVGMKEECTTIEGAQEVCSAASKRDNFSVIVAGGSQRRFEKTKEYGASTFLAGIGSCIMPELDLQDNLKLEEEFFAITDKYGWHRSMRYLIGVMLGTSSGNRAPFKEVCDDGKKELYSFITKQEYKK